MTMTVVMMIAQSTRALFGKNFAEISRDSSSKNKKEKIMNTKFLKILTIALALPFFTACGGSSSGGDDTSVVEGNVSQQVARQLRKNPSYVAMLSDELQLLRSAFAAVPGIAVSIRDTGLSSETDDQGFFRIEGAFAGDVILDFALPEATISLSLTVPAGNRVVLQDISINQSTGQAQAAQTIVLDDSDDDSSDDDDESFDENTDDSSSDDDSFDDDNSSDDLSNDDQSSDDDSSDDSSSDDESSDDLNEDDNSGDVVSSDDDDDDSTDD